MPTYVIPSSDEKRRLQMRKAASRAQQDSDADQAVLSSSDRVTELTAINQRFEAASNALSDAEETVQTRRDALEAAAQSLKGQVQQGWKIARTNMANGTWAGAASIYYVIPESKAPEYPHSPETWINAGYNLIDGNARAMLKGYPGLLTLPLLQAAYNTAVAALTAYTQAGEAQVAARKALGPLREQVDDILKLVVGDLRYSARQEKPVDVRRLLRAYGAQFRYRQNEPVDAEDSGTADSSGDLPLAA